MDIEVTNKRDNPLLSRKEFQFSVKYEGPTPKFAEVRQALAEKIKSDEKLTVIDSVTSEYGRQKAHGYAKVYESEEALKVEPTQIIKKNLEGKKNKGATAEGGEAASEEKPAEEAAEKEKPSEETTESKADEVAEEKEGE